MESVLNTNVIDPKSTDGLSSVVLARPLNGTGDLELGGPFIEIEADPRVELANQLGLDLNELNEAKVDLHGHTSV